MNEKILLKIALIISIIGLVVLYFISENLSLPDFDSTKINEYIGKDVVVSGIVLEYKSYEKYSILTLKNERYGNTIPVLIFDGSLENLESKQNNSKIIGKYIRVIGEIREFKGKPEVIAYEIKISIN